jgi:hypothetical protein
MPERAGQQIDKQRFDEIIKTINAKTKLVGTTKTAKKCAKAPRET